MESKMIKSDAAPVVGRLKMFLIDLDKDEVGIAEPVAEPPFPLLVQCVSKAQQQPAPKLLASIKIADVDFDMVQAADFCGVVSPYTPPREFSVRFRNHQRPPSVLAASCLSRYFDIGMR